jgi:hypothetical protein
LSSACNISLILTQFFFRKQFQAEITGGDKNCPLEQFYVVRITSEQFFCPKVTQKFPLKIKNVDNSSQEKSSMSKFFIAVILMMMYTIFFLGNK